MIKVTALDGMLVCRAEDPVPVRLHAPRWFRLDRHLKWLVTPARRRASVKIRFLGDGGTIVSLDIRAIAEV